VKGRLDNPLIHQWNFSTMCNCANSFLVIFVLLSVFMDYGCHIPVVW